MSAQSSRIPRGRWLSGFAALSMLIALPRGCTLTGCALTDFSEPQRLPAEQNRLCRTGSDPCDPGQKCFRAGRLGGDDFCATACDPSAPIDADHVCEAGALLTRCHPNRADEFADCPEGLKCYRTSFTEDAGVCLSMPVCKTDNDCANSDHQTCAASIVLDQLGIKSLSGLDHLNCVQEGCRAGQANCPNGETCLGSAFYTPFADFCTPKCDEFNPCPPNYSCAVVTSGSGSPKACLPGMPGFRCVKDHCFFGQCIDTGVGFSVCAVSCQSNSQCAFLNTDSERFQCSDLGLDQKYCLTPLPFHGANCTRDEQCRVEAGEFCSKLSDTGTHDQHLECRVRCDSEGKCARRAGLPHVCHYDGGCYPGQLGLPCKASEECFQGLSCELVAADAELMLPEQTLCTMPCTEDGDCNPSDGINFNGYCSAGYCRVRREYDMSCVRDLQCISGKCDVDHRRCLVGG